jgi:hypothetical protein
MNETFTAGIGYHQVLNTSKETRYKYNMHTVACTAIAMQQVDKQLCYATHF